MATTGNQWETVGKNPKKAKAQPQFMGQQRKKLNPDNLPKIETAPPVKESPTIYDAFIEKERRAQIRSTGHIGQGDSNGNQVRKSGQQKKKSTTDKKKEPVVTLDEAVAKIEVTELETVLAKDQATFPDNRSVWLLDLASLLNLRLECVPETDPLFEGKPADYPVCLLPKKVKSVLHSTIQQCSTTTLTAFAEHCMQSMISDMSKGVSTYGYRMFLQLLAHSKADVIIQSLPKYLEMVQSNKNRPLRCLAIMWSVGQVGVKDLSKGLKVWLELMLPVLNCRALSSYGVTYLDTLFKLHSAQKTANGAIGFKNFFPILDHIFSQQSAISSQLQKKLLSLYPRIKVISFGPEPQSSLRNFFPSFLARLTPHCPPSLKAEVLECLVTCLSQDRHCFSVWRQMYDKHLYQSSVLLQHLVSGWSALSRRLDRKLLAATIRAFSVTNDELAQRGGTAFDGYRDCVDACKELLTKMSRRFPWRWLLFLLFAALAGTVSYDVYTSKGFKGSQTARLLTESGVLVFLQQVGARLKLYTGKLWLWLEENVPYYYGRLCELVGPYLVLFWEKLYQAGAWLVAVTEPQRRWLHRKVPELLDWAQQKWPGLWSSVLHYVDVAWTLAVHYFSIAWEFVLHYALIAGAWLQENVFTGSLSVENLQKTFSAGLLVLREYVYAAVQWCVQLVRQEQ